MRRVVITGMGIVSCLGNDLETVADALKKGRSGISFQEEYEKVGMRSHIAGVPDINLKELTDRKAFRFMGDAAASAYVAMPNAIDHGGVAAGRVSYVRTGLFDRHGGW